MVWNIGQSGHIRCKTALTTVSIPRGNKKTVGTSWPLCLWTGHHWKNVFHYYNRSADSWHPPGSLSYLNRLLLFGRLSLMNESILSWFIYIQDSDWPNCWTWKLNRWTPKTGISKAVSSQHPGKEELSLYTPHQTTDANIGWQRQKVPFQLSR